MKINFKSIGTITKINFKQTTWIAYLVALLSFASTFVQTVIRYFLNTDYSSQISAGNELLSALIIAAVLIPAVNFKKIMHLNAKKIDFFWASILNYIIFSAVLSIITLALYYTVDNTMRSVVDIFDIVEIFGWLKNGIIIAFFRQFAFYLLLGVVIHTLTAMQTFWFGWVIDAVIIVIISVFTPIAPLRTLLVDFFNLIIFNTNALTHIAICLVLSVAIYALNIPILNRKQL
ncbi:MAG: hypothetical protein ACYDG2_05090 [Ruminiclostridium sp.]